MKTITILALAASLSACATPQTQNPTGPAGVPSDQRPPQKER